MPPVKYPSAPLTGDDGPKIHWITAPTKGGGSGVVLMEWELTGESWTDEHVHDEYAYVLEGRLFVEADGVTVEAVVGDTVCVPGGSVGRYYAPVYARMFGVYAPNPSGVEVKLLGFEKIVNRP